MDLHLDWKSGVLLGIDCKDLQEWSWQLTVAVAPDKWADVIILPGFPDIHRFQETFQLILCHLYRP